MDENKIVKFSSSGVHDTAGVSSSGVHDTVGDSSSDVHYTAEWTQNRGYLGEYESKTETTLASLTGANMGQNNKKQTSKSRDTVPLKYSSRIVLHNWFGTLFKVW